MALLKVFLRIVCAVSFLAVLIVVVGNHLDPPKTDKDSLVYGLELLLLGIPAALTFVASLVLLLVIGAKQKAEAAPVPSGHGPHRVGRFLVWLGWGIAAALFFHHVITAGTGAMLESPWLAMFLLVMSTVKAVPGLFFVIAGYWLQRRRVDQNPAP